MINTICPPILAITPFPTTLIAQGDIGRVGLSGPNVELITFNSGDALLIGSNINYAVGLGVARIVTTGNELSQLGIVLNKSGRISNFEIAYSANIVSGSVSIVYILSIIRSLNNNGNDYFLPFEQNIFIGILNSTSTGQVSDNRLRTVPISPGNVNVNIGDRLVLRIVATVGSAAQVTVSASVQFTPSGI